MIKFMILPFVLGFAVNASALDQIEQETRYLQFAKSLTDLSAKSVIPALGPEDAKLLVDALWDAQEEGLVPLRLRETLRRLSNTELSLNDQLRVGVLRNRVGMSFSRRALGSALLMGLADPQTGEALALTIISLRADLKKMGLTHLVSSARVMQPNASAQALKTEQPVIGDQTLLAKDLWDHPLDLNTWYNGKYAGGVAIYQFCRSNRLFPCVQVLRDAQGQPVRNADGTLWSQPSLSMSARNLPSNQRNGSTPSGIHTLNGVMPVPDQVPSFGRFRRVILDFVPKSANEARQREILPGTSQDSSWWRPNVVARDIGRNLFRIHGSGKLNEDPTSSWFPFRPTSGCISKRENTYGDVEYQDQQLLLNQLMTAQGLEVKYENETAIRGVLFLIEINDEAAPVTTETLATFGVN